MNSTPYFFFKDFTHAVIPSLFLVINYLFSPRSLINRWLIERSIDRYLDLIFDLISPLAAMAREKYFEICTSSSSILSSSPSLHWKSSQELVNVTNDFLIVKPSEYLFTTYSFRSVWQNCSLFSFLSTFFP